MFDFMEMELNNYQNCQHQSLPLNTRLSHSDPVMGIITVSL